MTDAATAQELDALAMQAQGLDGEVDAQAPAAQMAAQEEAQVHSLAEENAQGVAMVFELALPMLVVMYPSLERVYTPEAQARMAGALGPVMAKYGISLKEWGGKYREEIGALFVCGPVALATYKAIRADIEAEHKAASRPGAVIEAQAQGRPAPPTAQLQPGDYGYREPELHAG